MAKPSIVVVPGAFHVPKHFSKVTTILEKDGYRVVGVRLPSPGDGQPSGAEGNVQVVRRAVEKEVQAGHDVVLVVHSASGTSAPAAIEGLTKQAGSPDPGVIRILALSAILTLPGTNILETLAGQTCEWLTVERDKMVPLPFDEPGDIPKEPGRFRCSPLKALYNDCTEKQQREAYDMLVPIYADAFSGKFDYVGWQHIPLTYVFLGKDIALMPVIQRQIVDGLGVKVDERSIDASHSPFLSAPQAVADLIEEAASM